MATTCKTPGTAKRMIFSSFPMPDYILKYLYPMPRVERSSSPESGLPGLREREDVTRDVWRREISARLAGDGEHELVAFGTLCHGGDGSPFFTTIHETCTGDALFAVPSMFRDVDGFEIYERLGDVWVDVYFAGDRMHHLAVRCCDCAMTSFDVWSLWLDAKENKSAADAEYAVRTHTSSLCDEIENSKMFDHE